MNLMESQLAGSLRVGWGGEEEEVGAVDETQKFYERFTIPSSLSLSSLAALLREEVVDGAEWFLLGPKSDLSVARSGTPRTG